MEMLSTLRDGRSLADGKIGI